MLGLLARHETPVFTQLSGTWVPINSFLTQAMWSGAVLAEKCLIRVGISVTFCLMCHPSHNPTNTGEQASQNKMFTFIKSIVISRILLIFTGKNKRFWEFPKQVEMLKNG